MTKKNSRKQNTPIKDPIDELRELALALNLTALVPEFHSLLATAADNHLSYSQFALNMLRFENTARQSRRLTRNLKRSKLPDLVKTLDDFDFSIRPNLEARVVKELLNCRWVDEHRNIICLGPPGLGKSHIINALTKAACLHGHAVLSVITAEMLEDLHASLADNSLRRAFLRYQKPAVLCCDEFGYEPFDADATKYLFRLVSARHGHSSILLAANTGFSSWKRFFPSEAQAVATVDRLIDGAIILRFSGKSRRQPLQILGASD
jgi:DNA replication protein DnaC